MVRNLFEQHAPEPASETIDVTEAASRLGIAPDTCRAWIRQDMSDGGRRVPGGRQHGARYVIIRAVFERAMRDGLEPEPRPAAPVIDLEAIRRELTASIDRALQGVETGFSTGA